MNTLRTIAVVVVAVVAGAVSAFAVDSTHPASRTIILTAAPAASAVASAPRQGLTVNQIYRKDAPGVVVVTATTTTTTSNPFDPFGAPQKQQQQALGSGFVIDRSGHILTNAHVVLNASKVQVAFGSESTAKTYTARVLGVDRSTDVAVLKVDAPAQALTPLTLGNSSTVEVGDPVVAIGNPLGETRTATTGIVSAVNRDIGSLQGNVQIRGAIQTDAAINHGNSGGPLLNSAGEVIGVNAQIESNSNDNAGVGFAIPIDAVKSVASDVISGKTVEHAYLGVSVQDATSSAGATIESVKSGSPADKAGLKAGDIVTVIDGKSVANADDLTALVATYKPGDTAKLTVKRNGNTQTISVTFGQRPSS
jgi:putative serine protease PepD